MSMQVKIFRGHGHDGIAKAEREINEWLTAQPYERRIISTDTALCGIAEEGDPYATMKNVIAATSVRSLSS